MAFGKASRNKNTFQQITRRIEPRARLRRSWPLTGGVSARVTALDVVRPDGSNIKLILRQHGAIDRERNPRLARDEFRLLQIVRAHDIAAPEPFDFDESGDLLPSPYLIVAFVNGQPEFDPLDLPSYLAQAAAQLAKIHAVSDSPELASLPRWNSKVESPAGELDASIGEARIRAALTMWPPSNPTDAAPLHGDYWPGNLLWHHDTLVAVIDWEDAALGDPLTDLSNSRLEFLWALGNDVMESFTDEYRSLTAVDLTDLPFWDLRAALRPCSKLSGWGLDVTTDRRMRARHRDFVSRAIATLALRSVVPDRCRPP